MPQLQASDLFSILNPFNHYQNKDQREGMYEYVPSNISAHAITTAMQLFKERNGRKAKTFLDLGCGKGGVLYTALSVGLTPTGVEISDELLTLARRLKRLGIVAKSNNISLIKGDILKWVPYKQYDIVYFYHPLRNEHLHRQFIQHVYRSFPIGQHFIILGDVAGHKGFKFIEESRYNYFSIALPGAVKEINGYRVVAKLGEDYIVHGFKGEYFKATDITSQGDGVYESKDLTKIDFTLL